MSSNRIVKMPAVVYAYLDEDGEVVYVGQTVRPEERQKEHAKCSPWHRDGLTWHVLMECDHRARAVMAEGWFIRVLKPRWNITHNRSAA